VPDSAPNEKNPILIRFQRDAPTHRSGCIEPSRQRLPVSLFAVAFVSCCWNICLRPILNCFFCVFDICGELFTLSFCMARLQKCRQKLLSGWNVCITKLQLRGHFAGFVRAALATFTQVVESFSFGIKYCTFARGVYSSVHTYIHTWRPGIRSCQPGLDSMLKSGGREFRDNFARRIIRPNILALSVHGHGWLAGLSACFASSSCFASHEWMANIRLIFADYFKCFASDRG